MKIFVRMLVMVVIGCGEQGRAAEAGTTTSTAQTSVTAAAVVSAAMDQARAESKKVFLLSGFPGCSWCKLFDRFHETPDVKQIVDKYYVVAKIDTMNMADGRETFEKYGKVGAPAWVILTQYRKVLMTSDDENGVNVGYPFKPEEQAHYVRALSATSTITTEETDKLRNWLLKIAETKKTSQ